MLDLDLQTVRQGAGRAEESREQHRDKGVGHALGNKGKGQRLGEVVMDTVVLFEEEKEEKAREREIRKHGPVAARCSAIGPKRSDDGSWVSSVKTQNNSASTDNRARGQGRSDTRNNVRYLSGDEMWARNETMRRCGTRGCHEAVE